MPFTQRLPRRARALVWLRRDLRLADNTALFAASRDCESVCCVFVLDPVLLASDRIGAPIVQAFFSALAALREQLRAQGSDLAILRGDFAEQLGSLADRLGATCVYYNEDCEPALRQRDARVSATLGERGITTHAMKDLPVFGHDEILTEAGTPYKIFTPYKRRWLEAYHTAAPLMVPSLENEQFLGHMEIGTTLDVPTPEDFGFTSSDDYPVVNEATAQTLLTRFLEDGSAASYARRRNFPAMRGTSGLSPQLRAGTIGVRTCVHRGFDAAKAASSAARSEIDLWISELIWRDFYLQILRNFPHVADGPFVDAANALQWSDDRVAFDAWCRGATGYPIVDAAMRQLNTYGWMHNRLRMIVASFLTKDLLINWQWGERYFERQLADADVAGNNGGWQWAASTGTDAAPYFRIFSPVLQSEKFDPQGRFIRKMLPELREIPDAYIHAPWKLSPLQEREFDVALGVQYPLPIVDHAQARIRALAAYEPVLGKRSRGAVPSEESAS